jgi:hypothetical protein
MILCDFNYYSPNVEAIVSTKILSNFANNSNDFLINASLPPEKKVQLPYVIEYILIFWVVSYTCEEFNQVKLFIEKSFKKGRNDKNYFIFLVIIFKRQ